jgi:prolyl oligopeptidase
MSPTEPPTPPEDDPLAWLEDIDSEAAMAWVRERNACSQGELMSRPEYSPARERLLASFNAQDRIPAIRRRGDWLYNFWQDEAHPRGLWRRCTLASYRSEPVPWEVLLDLDALAAHESENWVWGGAHCLGPAYRHALVMLSRGGADAKVVREFDLSTLRFVEGGFELPEAKSDVDWVDADTLYVGTDFGPGSMTDSGYARVIKRWRRGTPLADAPTVFEGQSHDVAVGVSINHTPGHERTLFARALDFYNQQYFLLQGEALVPLDAPSDAGVHFWGEHLLLSLRSDWALGTQHYPSGSLLCTEAAAYLRGERVMQVIFTPTPTCSLAGYTCTRSHLVLNLMDRVASRLEQWHRGPDGRFVGQSVPAPSPGSLDVASLHDPLIAKDPWAEHYLLSHTGFLTPDSLSLAHTAGGPPELLKSRVAQFNSSGMQAEQRFATSADGTEVPYFVIGSAQALRQGNNPTLLYGYGGFEISLTPWYASNFGPTWFERGGVLVVANIRGGGEFGPAWHQAATREHKQRSYDDFIAVAQHLITSGLTCPRHLGIMGGSNGGLLVGAAFTQRPDLFNAVVCQVPLLDMRRYHRLLAGASWMAEYGNPDEPADWAFISAYSPYHQVRAGVRYPKVLFTTSTRDDRVHPAHARKMAERMRAQGHELLYFENTEGGHSGAANNAQRAHVQALEFAYLWQQLG